MTNRNSPPRIPRGVKKPRLRRVEITFPGSPEPVNNGMRPHGGYRGARPCPMSQYSHNKNDGYQEDLDEEFKHLIDQEQFEKIGGSPFWLADMQREITHSGESPLFTNKLLASGKFEQEHGFLKFERALLATRNNRRQWSAPSRRRGQKQFYRQNRTHQYLSATDLRKINDVDEYVIKYGRPTRATLLRAMQRSNSAPVNAYDIRRENMKRVEDLRNRSIFYTSKEVFDREQTRFRYRFFNIYSSEGETTHSFLTGARYNRAHLLDSKGLEVYGVYMPRENPAGCFMTGPYRIKDHGDEIPSAPPDSPRSDLGDSPSPEPHSRPDSAKVAGSRPTSSRTGSSLPSTRTPPSRPQSYRQMPGGRPKSGTREQQNYAQNLYVLPKSSEGIRRLPEEVTMHVPDHVNPKGKSGVYVTLKGHKMLDTVESKLPRVTGISLPKLRKRHDAVEETLYVNQPPPTPVDISLGSLDRNKFEALHGEQLTPTEPIINEEVNIANLEADEENVPKEEPIKQTDTHKEVKFADRVASIVIDDAIKELESEQKVLAKEENVKAESTKETTEKAIENNSDKVDTQVDIKTHEEENKIADEMAKYEVLDSQETVDETIIDEVVKENAVSAEEETKESKNTEENKDADKTVIDDNVVFFVTEEKEETEVEKSERVEKTVDSSSESDLNEEEDIDIVVSNGENNVEIENVIRVEVTETEKTVEAVEPDKALTSENFPFTDNSKQNDDKDYMV